MQMALMITNVLFFFSVEHLSFIILPASLSYSLPASPDSLALRGNPYLFPQRGPA